MANTNGAINLGEGPDFDSLSQEQQQKLREAAEQFGVEPEPEVYPATTAFIVVINSDNSVFVNTDLSFSVSAEREATVNDIKIGLSEALDAIKTQLAANYTAQVTQQAMMQMGQRLQEQAQTEQIKSRLKL